MRLTIKGTGLIDCGGTLADLGKEEMSRRYREKSVLAHAKLGQLEDIEERMDVDLIRFLTELIYVLDNASETVGYTTKGRKIVTDYGYVKDFLKELKEGLL